MTTSKWAGLILIVAFSGCAGWPRTKAVVPRADRGIHLTLTVDKTEYAFAEEVPLTAELRNTTDRDVAFPCCWESGDRQHGVSTFTLRFQRPPYGTTLLSIDDPCPPVAQRIGGDFVVPARGTVAWHFTLREVLGILPPGKHTMWLEHRVLPRPGDVGVHLVSNSVTIRVLRSRQAKPLADRLIRLRLECDRTQYRFGEEIPLRIVFLNPGGKDVTLPPTVEGHGALWLVKPGEGQSLFYKPSDPRPPSAIPARGSVTVSFKVHEIVGHVRPGTHTFRVRYAGETDEFVANWTSNAVTVRVLEQPKDQRPKGS